MPVALPPPPPRTVWLRPEIVASWPEVLVVIAILVGPFAWRSTVSALAGSAARYIDLLLSDSRLLENGAIESALLAAFLFFLHRRGWTPRDFKILPNLWSTLQGGILFLVTEVGHVITAVGLFVLIYVLQTRYHDFASFFMTQVPHLRAHSIDVSWAVLIPTMILNAFFEELLCICYFFNQIAAKHGPLAALILTVLLRMSCHTYQGPVNVDSIGVLFLIYGLWYWYTRNLWPLIAAHATLDLFSTTIVKLVFGH